jgi:hypothetical protein
MKWHFLCINIYFRCSYRFSHLSFNIEAKDGSKQNEVLFSWIFIPPVRVIHWDSTLKFFLSLSLSNWFHCRADLTLSSYTLWHKKRHTEKCLKLNRPNSTQILILTA